MMLQEKILKELEGIPETKLAELYDIIHYFRIGLEQETCENPTMKLAGAWTDMRDDLFESLMNEIEARRSRAFSGNQD
jgi:hypothetical protein